MPEKSNYPLVVFGKQRLKGRSHFSSDRYLSMIVRGFRDHNCVIVECNHRTEGMANVAIAILEESFKITKERQVVKKGQMTVIRYSIEKPVSII